MARKKRWFQKSFENGVEEIEIFSWDYFGDFIYQELLDFQTYVFRGHRVESWKLEPTLDRELKGTLPNLRAAKQVEHLESFKMAVRGRRGPNPPKLETENDWWALGQHFGLSTPLLDWTASPYAAAFFAFEKRKHDDTPRRVIWCLSQGAVRQKCHEVLKKTPQHQPAQVVDFVRPLSDENSRLVNQGGLFTRAPLGVDLEEWIRTTPPISTNSCDMIKISVPSADRTKALKELNRMNINYLTLFPDLFGASQHCNTRLKISSY